MRIYKYRALIFLGVLITILTPSCKKYLDKTPAADISETDVFSNFANFQGFEELLYNDFVDFAHGGNSVSLLNFGGDDIVPTQSREMLWVNGDYLSVMSSNRSPYYNTAATQCTGNWRENPQVQNDAVWQNSWFGIRGANVAISHLKDVTVATDEQKRFLEGQAYFFRGAFYWELIKTWGPVPYADSVLAPTSSMHVPVLGLYQEIEKVVADLQHAASLLPDDWDSTVTGQPTFGTNRGRATKGMALGIEAECLMFAASPLYNGTVNGTYTYNLDYCKRSAAVAAQVIQLANQGVYALEPWATYSNMFYMINGTLPRSNEIVFQYPNRGDCHYFSYAFLFGDIGGSSYFDAPSENYVELFETASGLPITDPQSGFDPMDPWVNRDPRFSYNIMIDGDRRVKSTPASNPISFAQLYTGGRDRTATQSRSGFSMKKYWNIVINRIDAGWNYYFYAVPRLRLAEIYLDYAEMANEAYGPNGKDPGANITAVDAVNIVRNRANMPDVNTKFLDNIPDFRARIWNERAVELAFENKRWFDIRRWHVATLPQYTQLMGVDFDKAHTYFNDFVVYNIAFTDKNYWMPFPQSQVNLYSGWKQNPGW